MPRLVIILIITSLIVSACGNSSVWGVAPTPTPESAIQQTPPVDPLAGSSDPIIFPTSTTPPQFETQSAYTPTPQIISFEITPTNTSALNDSAPFLYYAQSGDMLSAVSSRFNVNEAEIISDADLTRTTLIDNGVLLVIPNRI
ncbi:MAG TPA: hypothetical protein PLX90_11375, partial [Anaerolineales bacterium]|nr:hypothetical protein [Anaerolineales bacterium]